MGISESGCRLLGSPFLTDDGEYISVDGLWALAFGTDPSANGRKNQLFFTTGPLFHEQGLFGAIEVDENGKN